MKFFAQIDNGLVTGHLEAQAAPRKLPAGRSFVEFEDGSLLPALLSTYAAGVFTPPPARVIVKRLSRFEFMALLTANERAALRARAPSDAVMADALAMLELAGHVDAAPMHPMISQMLGYVQQIGIMTAERRAGFEAAVSAAAY